jgi:hypothetical protein
VCFLFPRRARKREIEAKELDDYDDEHFITRIEYSHVREPQRRKRVRERERERASYGEWEGVGEGK